MALRRDMLMVAHLPLLRNLSHVLFYSVTDLIAGWGHYGTNNRRALLDTRLLYDAPHGHPICRLHPGASQDLTAALYLHKQHTHIETYSQM
jgi:hypothetical protein